MFDKKLIKISILIPCFNENNTINMIIDRVIKSLEVYNFTNYEIIIVDDFSNDGTREKLKKLSIGGIRLRTLSGVYRILCILN